METLLEILVGQLPEAIYFALFLLFTKELKKNRLLFVVISSIEYVLLFHTFPYSIWSHIMFFIITYIVLKILYKERAQITDVFTLGIASLIIVALNIIMYFIMVTFTKNYFIYVAVCRTLLFVILFVLKPKLPKIQKVYKKLWNRNDSINKKMKSTTFRALNTVIFNIMFFIINFCLICAVTLFWR